MRIRATGIVIHDNKLLMIHRFRDGKEYYVLPGGGVEEGESPQEAVVREIKEETSVETRLNSGLALFSHNYTADTGEESIHQLFLCEYISGTPALQQDSVEKMRADHNNIYDPIWVDLDRLESMTIWPVETKKWLMEYLKK